MNFDYLKNNPDFTALYNYCNECEQFAFDHPDISITAARKAMEYMVKLLYGAQIDPGIQRLSLFDMISDYDFIEYIGNQDILDSIHFIRRKGNQAVHEGNMDTQSAMQTLKNLHFVTGEICIKIGIIKNYTPFSADIARIPCPPNESATLSVDPTVDEMLIKNVSEIMRRRIKTCLCLSSS